MIAMHPAAPNFNADDLAQCIDECFNCAQTCKACIDACLVEDNIKELTKCIRLNLDCADICIATGSILSRLTDISEELISNQLKACSSACQIAGRQCRSHQQLEHCQLCADSCAACKDICDTILNSITISVK